MIEMFEALGEFINNIVPFPQTYESLEQLAIILPEVSENHNKKFFDSSASLIAIYAKYMVSICDELKISFLTVLITNFESNSSRLKSKSLLVEQTFDLICLIMANISNEIPDVWYNPPQNYDESNAEELQDIDEDTYLVVSLRDLVNELASIFGYMNFYNLIEGKALGYFSNGDWRWKNAILMCLSQISESIELSEIGNAISLIKMGVANNHPKVRFAAIQALGQISNDLNPSFQFEYLNEVIPMILDGMKEPVERVRSHWFACITNFFENYDLETDLSPYIGQIIQTICESLLGNHHLSKETGMSALATISTIPFIYNEQDIKKHFEICNSILEKYSASESKMFIGRTIECMSAAIGFQSLNLVKDYLNFFYDKLLEYFDKIDYELTLDGWVKLFSKSNYADKWTTMHEKVLNMIKTQDNEELYETYIATIENTAITFSQESSVHVIESLTWLHNAFKKELDQNVSSLAVQAIQRISIKSRPVGPNPEWDFVMTNMIVEFMLQLIPNMNSKNFDFVIRLAATLDKFIQSYSYHINNIQLNEFLQIIFGSFDLLQNLKAAEFEFQSQYDENLYELDYDFDKNVEYIDETRESLTWLLRTLIKSTSNPEAHISKVYSIGVHAIENKLNERDVKFGVYLFDDLIEMFEYHQLQEVWERMVYEICELAKSQNAILRTTGVFGIGLIILKFPEISVTMSTIEEWAAYLKNAYLLPKTKPDKKNDFGFCQDNCVSAVGKMLKKYHKKFNLRSIFESWLDCLPLKYDLEENEVQMKFLCEILEKCPDALFWFKEEGLNLERLKCVVKVFGSLNTIFREKEKNRELLLICERALSIIRNWELFKSHEVEINSCLSKKNKQILNFIIHHTN